MSTVVRSLEEVAPVPSAVTIGFFDGVHRGHQTILSRAVQAGRERDLRSVVVTFDRHPREVVAPEAVPSLLMTPERRVRCLTRAGSDLVLVLAFTDELSRLSPQAFVEQVLVEALHARVVVVGANFRFGHRAAGDVTTLARLGRRAGFEAEAVTLTTRDGAVISASEIRQRVAAGDVEWAAETLSRAHTVDGVVVAGHGRGRSLGIPTANVAVDRRLVLPANGVYAGHVQPDGPAGHERLPAVTNVGVRPTFDGGAVTVEAHLLDFDGDLYRRELGVEFAHRLRGEWRFDNPEDLVVQMRADIATGRRLLTG